MLMFVTILAKLFGLGREKVLAQYFGTSALASMFLVAITLPMLVSNLLSGAVATGYIPIYEQINHQDGQDEANKFTSNLINILIIIFILITILSIIGARPLVKMMAPSFTGDTLNTAVYMTRIALVSMITTSAASVLKAFLQIKDHFIVSMCHSVIMNIILIIGMVLSQGKDVQILSFSILIALVFQYIFFLPYIRKAGYHHQWILDIHHPQMSHLLKIIVPILISTSVIELNLIINKAIASSISMQGISVINYASKIQGFVTGIVITSIITAIYPRMAKMSTDEDVEGLRKITNDMISLMSLLVIPATLGLMVFSNEVVRLLFLGGAFGEADVQITGHVLLFYAVGLVGIGIREISTRVFYSMGETVIPVKNSVIMVVLNVLFSFILSRFFGMAGLAMGTSLSLLLGAVLITLQMKKHLGLTGFEKNKKNLFLITISAVIMSVGAKGAYLFLTKYGSQNLSLLLSILIGGIIYGICVLIFKIDEVRQAFAFIKNR